MVMYVSGIADLMRITIAHTPDPDDAFMFYAMLEGKIRTHFEYNQVVKDIETLNGEAGSREYEVTAISANAYATLAMDYYLLSSGASFGISYGPQVVATKHIDLEGKTIAIPGNKTSAYLLYRMFAPPAGRFLETRFDLITESVISGKADAGVLIHDEQLTYQNKGLVKVLDLYEKWKAYAGDLPIPLGFNAIRKDLGKEKAALYQDDFRKSIEYAIANEEEAVRYAMKFARYDDFDLERKFVRMYVNALSVDFGERGRKALDMYYGRAAEMGLIRKPVLEVV